MKFHRIEIYGSVYYSRDAKVVIETTEICRDGIVAVVTVEAEDIAAEYKFQLKAFFYGYNLKCFVEEVEEMQIRQIEKEARLIKEDEEIPLRAVLINYNERFEMEILRLKDKGDFLSVRYLPHSLNAGADEIEEAEEELRQFSWLKPEGRWLSEFYLCFMKLHTPIDEKANLLREWLNSLGVSCKNPYPGGSDMEEK